MTAYWHERLKEEITAVLARDVDVGKVYEALYARTQQHIADLLTVYYERFVVGEESPYQIAKEFDVQAFMDQARIYVESKDFSPKANRELKLYNFAMRVNQLELLEGRLRLAMATLREEELAATKQLLLDEGLKVYEQQAGILKLAVPSAEVMQQMIKTLSQTSFHGVVWSERVWRRQVGLGRLVQEVVEGVTLRGRSPLEFVPELREQFSVGAYEAKRLAITESARLQSEVQKENYRFNHVEKYEYMAEPTACALCAALDGKTFKVSEMEPGSNACPMHPFCRCSTGPVPDEQGLEGMFREREAEKRADSLLAKASDVETKITEDLKEIVKQVGCDLVGLEYRIKTKKSLTRKILLKPSAKMRDVIRYTSVSDPEQLVHDYFEIVDQLKEKGYTVSEVKNTWTNPYSPYKGINTNVLTPSGYEFEIQYHTPESFELKNGKLHDLYEEQRKIKDTKSKRYIELQDEMVSLSSNLIVPFKINEVKSE